VGGDEETWKGHASSIFLIEDGGVREVTVREPSEQDCTVRDAVRVGGDLFAHVSCLTSSRIARVRKDGPRTSLAMPKLERTADGRVASATPGKSTLVCHPTSLSASASDLVVAATCRDDEHSIAVVLRQRHR